jgi:hypothetical protein
MRRMHWSFPSESRSQVPLPKKAESKKYGSFLLISAYRVGTFASQRRGLRCCFAKCASNGRKFSSPTYRELTRNFQS